MAEMSSVENALIPHDECEFPFVFTEKGKYKWKAEFAAQIYVEFGSLGTHKAGCNEVKEV